MKTLTICGGKPLRGEVAVSGFKNAALPVLFATILTKDISIIDNLPRIRDVHLALEILCAMGASVTRLGAHTVAVDTRTLSPCVAPDALVSSFRASSYLLGAELGRFGRARAALPGGCRIGARPLDLHVGVLEALGATVTVNDAISATAERLTGALIPLPGPSVGATVNAILAAACAEGQTVIVGAAREPHIVDLANFLNSAGALILGAGSPRITVQGVGKLHGTHFRLMPDMIEAGTFLTAVGAAGGEILLHGACTRHLDSVIRALRDMGMIVKEEGRALLAARRGGLAPFRLVARPYPGFPTDMHPQMVALATGAEGISTLRDCVFPDRFAYADELFGMGANVRYRNGEVTVCGQPLHAATVTARDLRAGAALAVAALGTAGRTAILNAGMLDRGYESFAKKMRMLGADVEET